MGEFHLKKQDLLAMFPGLTCSFTRMGLFLALCLNFRITYLEALEKLTKSLFQQKLKTSYFISFPHISYPYPKPSSSWGCCGEWIRALISSSGVFDQQNVGLSLGRGFVSLSKTPNYNCSSPPRGKCVPVRAEMVLVIGLTE